MIQEIINYMKYLRNSSPKIFEEVLEPSKGLHILVELDENGNARNFPGERGIDWDYYDGTKKSDFMRKIVFYDLYTSYLSMNKQKKFDPKQKIHSSSPFALAFNFQLNNEDKKKYEIKSNPSKKEKKDNIKLIRKVKIGLVKLQLKIYFENVLTVFKLDEEQKSLVSKFEAFLNSALDYFISENFSYEFTNISLNLKEKDYIKIYLKNIGLSTYEKVYESYLTKHIFNKKKYNLISNNEIYGVLDFMTTFQDGKVFLKHKTATFKGGVNARIKVDDAKLIFLFSKILKNLPNPLPIFIDEREFETSDQIIKIFRQNTKLSYGEIIKKLFDENENLLLENYYLLFFGYKNKELVLKDFDFVSRFRYYLKDKEGNYPEVKNLFGIKKKGSNELIPDKEIKNIFQFEWDIVRAIFNDSLVRIDKNNTYSITYFDDIKYESGRDLVYLMILKYRKAFYDYIYKSKEEAINCQMWDEILWNSILSDLRHDEIKKEGYHSEYSIKEKLNIWFSFYNYFANNKGRISMSSRIPELLEKVRQIVNDGKDEKHFDSVDEFMFGAGQLIYYLLQQSRATERSHALLEPFIQKVKVEQLQDSIARLINTYKHELSFGQGRFERLAAEVLAFDTKENLKKYQRFLLAGYFSTPVIYEKKENEGGEK